MARATAARMVSPASRRVDMPIEGGFVGMVDREVFDEWLRVRAALAGATRCAGIFESLTRDPDGTAVVNFRPAASPRGRSVCRVRARAVVGADGARSAIARECLPTDRRTEYVAAYHEIVRFPGGARADCSSSRCDIYYQGKLSPDFYAWIFPHGETLSIGVGSAHKGFSLRRAVEALREQTGLSEAETIRCEGAAIPLRPLSRWDNGRDVVLAGDAAGVVAPASGEGIYYATGHGGVRPLSEFGEPWPAWSRTPKRSSPATRSRARRCCRCCTCASRRRAYVPGDGMLRRGARASRSPRSAASRPSTRCTSAARSASTTSASAPTRCAR